jgi:pimeloyl-ACP methyl ester carboxylesterase
MQMSLGPAMSFNPGHRHRAQTMSPVSREKIIEANGVSLCVETFGAVGDPAILLVGGAAASMDWWDEEFCLRLAAGRRFVIRYDHRDTGRSTSYPPGAPPYTAIDLVADAVGVLDALGVERAHVVGISMGGALAQRVAVEHPDRVASLTLMSTSFDAPAGPGQAELPPASPEFRALFDDPPPEPDWSDRDAVIEHIVEGERAYAGSYPPDEPRLRELAGRIFDRSVNVASSMTNHWLIDSGTPVRPRLGEITAPTLVMHGTEDALFPYGHGEALASEIPGARLLPLEGVGHQMPPRPAWDTVIPAILEHTSAESGRR